MNTNNLFYNFNIQSDPYLFQPIIYPNSLQECYTQPIQQPIYETYILPLSIFRNQNINQPNYWFQNHQYYKVPTKEVDQESLIANQNNLHMNKTETESPNYPLKLEDNLENEIIQIKNDDIYKITPREEYIKKSEKYSSKTPKKLKQQAQYLPSRRNKQKTKKYQYLNENRNIIPNEINQIFSFVLKKKKSEHLLQRLMKKYPPENEIMSPYRFYLYQQLIKQKVCHYSTLNKLRLINELYEPECKIWQESQQRYYNKLCRMLIHHFLQEDSIFIILTSRKMKSSKKIDHLMARRHIAEKIREILSQK